MEAGRKWGRAQGFRALGRGTCVPSRRAPFRPPFGPAPRTSSSNPGLFGRLPFPFPGLGSSSKSSGPALGLPSLPLVAIFSGLSAPGPLPPPPPWPPFPVPVLGRRSDPRWPSSAGAWPLPPTLSPLLASSHGGRPLAPPAPPRPYGSPPACQTKGLRV